MLRRIRVGGRWLRDWPVRWTARHHELPDLPEVRQALKAWARKGWTFGAAPSWQELLTLHQEAAVALSAAPDEDEPVTGPS